MMYEIKAQNGQVIAHSLKSNEEAREKINEYSRRYPEDHFLIVSYEAGKYGTDAK